MLLTLLVVFGDAALAIVLSWLYFRRSTLSRPPLGVFTLADLVPMLTAVVIVPYLYLWLPRFVVVLLIGSSAVSLLSLTLEPVLRRRALVWLATRVLVAGDLVATYAFGTQSPAFHLVNNLVLIVMVVGITNLWAQAGMKARDLVVLGLALMVYDAWSVWHATVMVDMVHRLQGLPFAPTFVAGSSVATSMGLGLGDVQLAAVFPLVVRKAFGRIPGVIALGMALLALLTLLAAPLVLGLHAWAFPVMVVLGPLMLLQYLGWRRRSPEHTTRQYWEAEPLPRPRTGSALL